jgi:hypothetical protein
MSFPDQEQNLRHSELDPSSPQGIIEEFATASYRIKNGDIEDVSIVKIMGLPKVLKAGFWEWWGALQETGALKPWAGFRNSGEILTQEQKNKMDRALYDVFISQLQREGLVLTGEEIEEGYKCYEGH